MKRVFMTLHHWLEKYLTCVYLVKNKMKKLLTFVLLVFWLMERSDASISSDMKKALSRNSKRLHDWVNERDPYHEDLLVQRTAI